MRKLACGDRCTEEGGDGTLSTVGLGALGAALDIARRTDGVRAPPRGRRRGAPDGRASCRGRGGGVRSVDMFSACRQAVPFDNEDRQG